MRYNFFFFLSVFLFIQAITGCSSKNRDAADFAKVIKPAEVSIFEYHIQSTISDLEDFVVRLYARNPKYEKNLSVRRQKIDSIFRPQNGRYRNGLENKTSKELLSLSFAQDTAEDRVYLLGLGLVKSIQEAYGLDEMKYFLTGLQLSLERIERLHFNLSQVNWRLKTYKDMNGDLLFLTNGMSENGYLNMGYEVIMTRILTRVEDDIYLRGGLPQKYMFGMSTLFLSIVM
ncbi:MAG: hypothetical protein KQH63_08165 [Desulfobulbaceae bacterium]|nr:hypothetical protein [Desulfobulbaceae bacterium]